jgi:hypothetical protein
MTVAAALLAATTPLVQSVAVAQDEVDVHDTAISGFVDASYFENLANRGGEFGLDQVEIDLDHQASEKTLLRADLEWVKDGEGFLAQVEQAYMRYTVGADWSFTLGRFNAPIGFELLDPNEMYQYSHGLVFDYALPTNLTGLLIGKSVGENFEVLTYGVNGWDQNAETNRLKTYGGRMGYANENSTAGFSVISGKEGGGADSEFKRTVVDLDFGGTPEGWVYGGDLNFGSVKFTDGSEANWLGVLAMIHRDFKDWWGLTLRYDFIDDQDEWVFGPVEGEAQKRQAITLAPTFVLDEGLGVLVEARVDFSDRKAFIDREGEPSKTSTSFAVEMTYSF